jgi:Putative RNA methylase family UPF0020
VAHSTTFQPIDPPRLYYEADRVQIYHGDFRYPMPYDRNDPWLPRASYDAVITDPPYGKPYLNLWAPLARFSTQVLRRGGSLQAIMPHYAIPEVLALMSPYAPYLKWRWMLGMWQAQGAHPRMAMGIEVLWKPIGWWVKDAWPSGRGFKRDGFESPAPAKTKHVWEQNAAWALYCLSFVPPGGGVIDPMVGSGTLAVEALALGYHVVGIDIDERACEVSTHRIQTLLQEGPACPAPVAVSDRTRVRAARLLKRRATHAGNRPRQG